MKKIVLIAIFSIISLPCISQARHTVNVAKTNLSVIDGKDAAAKYKELPPYELWVDMGKGFYIMLFKMTPVGYKHCLDKVREILVNNDLSFENDRIEESVLIPNYVDGYDDYQNMPSQLEMGKAEFNVTWKTKDGDGIIIDCNDEFFQVMLIKHGE